MTPYLRVTRLYERGFSLARFLKSSTHDSWGRPNMLPKMRSNRLGRGVYVAYRPYVSSTLRDARRVSVGGDHA